MKRCAKPGSPEAIAGLVSAILGSGDTGVTSCGRLGHGFVIRGRLRNLSDIAVQAGAGKTRAGILDLVVAAREAKVGLIMVENYFDETVAARVAQEMAEIRVVSVPVAVEGVAGVRTLDDLFERIVLAVEGKSS